MSEEELVRRAQNGDVGAFGDLVRSHYHGLFALASRHVSEFDAEEVVQEAFLKDFGGIRTLRIAARRTCTRSTMRYCWTPWRGWGSGTGM